MSDQRNLFIAIVLSMAVVFGWQYLVGVPRMQEEQARQQQQAAQQPNQATPQAGAVPTVPATTVLPRDQALAQSPTRTEVETPTLVGSINLAGGRFDDLRLRNYHETPEPTSPEIELLSPRAAEHPYFAEFGWIAGQGSTAAVPGEMTQWTLAEGSKLAPGQNVEMTYDNGQGLVFTRRISVDERYMFTIADTVDNRSDAPVTLSPYGLVYRSNIPATTIYWVVHEGFIGVLGGTLKDPTYADLADGNETQRFESQGGWLGITDKYWMAAVIPPQSEQIAATYMAYDANGSKAYRSDYVMNPREVAPNSSHTVVHHLFAGAKLVEIVDDYAETLAIQRFDMAVDWGWFNPLTKWMFQALDFLNKLTGNFGVAILVFTVFVKAVFYPLANTSYRAMSKMKKLQPEMERLRERFKEDKAKQQQELMKLYQTEKVNPLAGCLPMLIQIPVFFSLYKVLLVTIDMRHAPFFGWIKDLSAPDPTSIFNLFGLIPIDLPQFLMLGVFPILMGVTMWIQTNLNPPPADPVQQRLFAFMPLIFTFMLASFPVGLVVYWTWNNLLSIIQQIVIMRRTGTPVDLIDRLRGMGKRLARGEAPEKPAGPPD
ncbi:MAG: membrane protein insertase YidC [Alphaproteobacteria bacterium]|nr:membrane protein insertase YidC [Alphaproteobacteria bacterium]